MRAQWLQESDCSTGETQCQHDYDQRKNKTRKEVAASQYSEPTSIERFIGVPVEKRDCDVKEWCMLRLRCVCAADGEERGAAQCGCVRVL